MVSLDKALELLNLIMKNVLIHGFGQDDKSLDKVKEYLR